MTSVALSDAQLAATARRIANAMFAGLMPGETGSNMSNEIAERVTAPYVEAVERLRAELASPRPCACWPAYEHSEHCPIYQASAPTDPED
jgi:hypothetical protein